MKFISSTENDDSKQSTMHSKIRRKKEKN